MSTFPSADNAKSAGVRRPLETPKKTLRNSSVDISSEIRHLFDFGSFQLDPHQHQLINGGTPVSVTPKAFDLLVALVRRAGKLVEKTELLSIVWPDVSVEEGNLAVIISQLRKALGDDRGKHEYIETVSKYGYRFVAPVIQRTAQEEEVIASPTEVEPGIPKIDQGQRRGPRLPDFIRSVRA